MRFAGQEADITRMQVGVDEAVDKRHLAKDLDTQRRHLAGIDSSRGQFRVPHPFEQVHGQHALAAQRAHQRGKNHLGFGS